MEMNGNHPAKANRILIVDDERAVHKLLSAYFRRHNYAVDSCLDSRDVIEKIEEFDPDLILLDLMMPELDGISAARRIRNLKRASYLPIIMLTARKEIRDIVNALEAGADDYISKPFDFEELMARIRTTLRVKRLQDRLMSKSTELNEANQQIGRLNNILVKTNKQLQKKLYDFHNIFELSYKVMGQLEFQELVRQSLINILGIFATRSAMLLMVTKENNDNFKIVDSRGFRELKAEEFTISRHGNLVHYLDLVKKPFQVRNVPLEFQEILPALKKLEIEVVSPLFRADEIVGLLCLGANFRDEQYSEDNLETLGLLTNMLGVALHNSQLYEHIRALSYTDGMTGLHNYRFFRMRIKEEIARARRENSLISLLIMDVDHFKNYNDTLGHPAGDDVLRQVSDILRSSVRDNDIVARYGGEEFAVILPGADKVGSYALAERIRQKVEEADFYKEEIQPLGGVTISIGTGTFPDDALTEDDLIVNTDQALYDAKKNGRNLVMEAQNLAAKQ